MHASTRPVIEFVQYRQKIKHGGRTESVAYPCKNLAEQIQTCSFSRTAASWRLRRFECDRDLHGVFEVPLNQNATVNIDISYAA
jgi:hypothetical protein